MEGGKVETQDGEDLQQSEEEMEGVDVDHADADLFERFLLNIHVNICC